MDDLADEIRRLTDRAGADWVAAACLWLDGVPVALVDAVSPVHAASTMKVPVLVEVFRQAASGEVSLDEALPVRNAFRSIVDGSTYVLDPGDDSETTLYERQGEPVSVMELARLMIVVSSNLATNLLVDRVGADRVSGTMRELGLPGLVVRRGVEDGPAHARGLDNSVTALDLALLLAAIADGRVVSPEASAAMEAVLAGQVFNEGIPTGLPPGTSVAHKTGSIPRLYHDAAIIRPLGARPYVLVVLTTGLDEEVAAPALVGGISSLAFAALTDQ